MSNEGLYGSEFQWGKGFDAKPVAATPARKRKEKIGTIPPVAEYVRPEEALQGLGRALRENPELARQLREALKSSSPSQEEAA
jgi:hypothetical protein